VFGLWLLSLVMSRGPIRFIDQSASAPLHCAKRIPTTLLLSLGAILLMGEAGTRIWYRINESEIASSRWTANWPQSQPDYQTVEIPPASREILRYDEGGGASWSSADTHRWMMYFFRWLPGQTAAIFVKIHRPDVCLPASGLTLTRDDGIHLLDVNGVKLPIRSYRFDDHGLPLHVFYCYWDARSSFDTVGSAVAEDWTPAGRVRAALNGRREIGAQMLELVVWGYEDDGEAKRALEKQLSEIVQARS
jgi:hypothetical protein